MEKENTRMAAPPLTSDQQAREPMPDPTISRVAVARGEGASAEVMEATLTMILAAGARLQTDEVVIGNQAIVTEDAWAAIQRARSLLMAPLSPPADAQTRLRATLRLALGLETHLRSYRGLDPVIPSPSGPLDLLIAHDLGEDLAQGLEYQQTPEVALALKMISRSGCERLIRRALAYAQASGRQHVTCMTKDNILKMTDGLFHKVFDEVGRDYPGIEQDHWIIDIGMAKLAASPQAFDVVVMPSLYGEMAAAITARLVGPAGAVGSALFGATHAVFEALDGGASALTGPNQANPSSLLASAIMLLVHLGQPEVAERVENAWLKTIEDRVVTPDLSRANWAPGAPNGTTVGTRDFARAVIDRLGEQPSLLRPARYASAPAIGAWSEAPTRPSATMCPRGADIFVHEPSRRPESFGPLLEGLAGPDFRLVMVSNRGQKVYPAEQVSTTLTDQFRCRFEADGEVSHARVRDLLARLEQAGFHWIRQETLFSLDGQRAYTLGQGQ